MESLIKALNIFLSKRNVEYPTHCEHDVMYVCEYNAEEFTEEEIKELDELGFFWCENEDCFMSFRYGSA